MIIGDPASLAANINHSFNPIDINIKAFSLRRHSYNKYV